MASGAARRIDDIQLRGRAGSDRKRNLQGHLLSAQPAPASSAARPSGRISRPTRSNPRRLPRGCETFFPIKINEVGFSTGTNATNQFIELYNSSTSTIDLSNWTLINTQSQWAPVKLATIPAGTRLVSGAYYLLGLSSSGLAAPASSGATVINVRSTTACRMARRSTSTAKRARSRASGLRPPRQTTVFIPVSTGPWITIPVGATNLPVTNTNGFEIGQKIGYRYRRQLRAGHGHSSWQGRHSNHAVRSSKRRRNQHQTCGHRKHDNWRHADCRRRRAQGARDG